MFVFNLGARFVVMVLSPITNKVAVMVIAAISLFFVGLFALSLTVGRRFHLGYADTATLVFTTTARNSESVIGVAAVAFVGHPLVLVAVLVGPVIELPALLGLSRIMLRLRHAIAWPGDEGRADEGRAQGTLDSSGRRAR
jgi:ACR3 family arsenite efflux pump ArsB